jgi:hypothetical protein
MMTATMSHFRSRDQFLGSSGSFGPNVTMLGVEVEFESKGSFSWRLELIFVLEAQLLQSPAAEVRSSLGVLFQDGGLR